MSASPTARPTQTARQIRRDRKGALAGRQREVCRLMLEGKTGLEISLIVNVSEQQVSKDFKAALAIMRSRAAAELVDRRADQITRLLDLAQFLKGEYEASKRAKVITTRQRMVPGPVGRDGRQGAPVAVEAIREEVISEAGSEKILTELRQTMGELSMVMGVRGVDRMADEQTGSALGQFNGPLIAVNVTQLQAPAAILSVITQRALAAAGGNGHGSNGGG